MPQQDACALLDSDHEKVERLFAEYQSATDQAKKSTLAQTICQELTVHATIEEEIFYPAFRQASGDDDMVDEAEEEHDEARDLITQIEDAEEMDSLMAELKEAVEHHVKEERDEMFPKAREMSSLDLDELATQLESRKKELMAGYQTV
jgi:iron-sulfur cluster repair protein YtfE (RIC family)